MKRELVAWLDTIHWDLWATYTFRYDASKNAARRAVERYMTRLRSTAKQLHYIAVIEDTGTNNHVHSLISGTKQCEYAQNLWFRSNGIAKVRRYSLGGGATSYLCKHIHLPTTEWWID